MKIRLLLHIGLILGAFVWSACGERSNTSTTAAPTSPNIIWLMAEDIGQDLACYGMAGVQTPNLDQMATDGIRYTQCYSTNPICSPNRSAMMLGVHQNISNTQHHRSYRKDALMEPFLPITHYLREAGYQCLLGSSLVRGKGAKTDVNFERGKWGAEGLFDTLMDLSKVQQPFFAQIQLNVTHRGDWWKEISAQSDDPVDPAEVVLPPYFADHPVIREDWARYLDQMEYMDREVGDIMKALQDNGLADNTIVIFIGDNGRCNIRGKGYLYQPGIQIPLIVWGASVDSGIVSDRLVDVTDISASILDLAGAKRPDHLSGIPFIGRDDLAAKDYIYAARDIWDEVEERSRSITDGRYKYIKNYLPEKPYEVGQAYLEFYRPAVHIMRKLHAAGELNPVQAHFFADSKEPEELYDLEQDPHETKNLAADPAYQTQLEQMRNHLTDWQSKHHDYGLDPIDWEAIEEPISVPMLTWLRETHPEVIADMQAGIEPGFSKWVKTFREAEKK
ncbi:MAG: sulfatase-like hydrolase/transferase [Bacteroidota bacterium]